MLALVVTGAIVGYAAWAYFHPFAPCRRCGGRGTNRLSTRRRSGRCRRCKGNRVIQTRGSKMLHRAVRSLVAYRSDKDK